MQNPHFTQIYNFVIYLANNNLEILAIRPSHGTGGNSIGSSIISKLFEVVPRSITTEYGSNLSYLWYNAV